MNRRELLKVAAAAGTLPWLVGGCTSRESHAFAAQYLTGNFAPVEAEITATDLRVTGQIPEQLVGRYLRNGPNPVEDVDPLEHHWFIGDGMVHGVRLDGGQAVWYRNRWVRSTHVANVLGEPGEGELPDFGPNTHVIGFADSTWALVEGGAPPVELDDELETIGVNTFEGTLPGGFTAHPKLDPDTGELHAMCYWWPNQRGYVQYVRIGPNGKVTKSVDIPVDGMPMIHDMSITERYIVIYDLPVTVKLSMLVTRGGFPFAWDDDHGARVGLLPRDGAAEDVIWIDVSPCYVYHPMNAYDDADGNVVIDVCRYERMFDRDIYGPFGDNVATLDRWTLNPTTRRSSETRIHDRGQEFPRCHPARLGKPYRYGYTAAVDGLDFSRIYKHDLKTGITRSIAMGAGRHTGEPYFIPREGGTAEDDGFLLSYVYDAGHNTSELVIWDAQDFDAPALARVHLPARVPYGFHGSWVPDEGVGV